MPRSNASRTTRFESVRTGCDPDRDARLLKPCSWNCLDIIFDVPGTPGKGWDQDRFRRVLPIVLRCERWVMSHVLHATACKYADMSTASFSPCLRSPLGPFITTTPSSTGPRIGREAQPLISGVLLPAREGMPERTAPRTCKRMLVLISTAVADLSSHLA
ncbi:hypothetical protein SMMN14_06051, partial [Sphaerulina musiva]